MSSRFRSEPCSIYAGAPARLLGFRFSEPVREKLLGSACWEMPLEWIRANNDFFLLDLTADDGRAMEALAELKDRKTAVAVKQA